MTKAKEAVYREPKRVSVQRAANGFIVSTYSDSGEAVEIAKTIDEANKIVKRILKGSKK